MPKDAFKSVLAVKQISSRDGNKLSLKYMGRTLTKMYNWPMNVCSKRASPISRHSWVALRRQLLFQNHRLKEQLAWVSSFHNHSHEWGGKHKISAFRDNFVPPVDHVECKITTKSGPCTELLHPQQQSQSLRMCPQDRECPEHCHQLLF